MKGCRVKPGEYQSHPPWGGVGLVTLLQGLNMPKFLDRGCGSMEPFLGKEARASLRVGGRRVDAPAAGAAQALGLRLMAH